MALYQDKIHVKHKTHAHFDKIHNPGVDAPYAGIYRCVECGHEIGIAKSHKLPPENHAGHPDGKPIRWQLLVCAEHKQD